MGTTASPHILIMPPGHVRTSLSPTGGVFQFDLGTALVRRGYKVGMLSVTKCPISSWFHPYRYPSIERVDDITIVRRYPRMLLPASMDRSFFIGKRLKPSALNSFARYCAEFGRPDVIHAHNIKYSAYLAAMLSKSYELPYVYTEHSSEVLSKALPSTVGEILRSVIASSSATSAVSRALRRSMCEISLSSETGIEVVPNILPSEFELPPIRDRSERREFRFVNVADALPVKRQSLLLCAFERSFKSVNATLTIVGAGPELAGLKRLAGKLGISGKVRFLGRLTRREIRDVFAQSDCFVLTSRHETFAVAVIEALSQGLPVVSTRCGGPEELIDDSNGVFAESDTIDGIAEAMEAVRSRIHSFDSGGIREKCIQLYSSRVVIDSYIRLYERAIGI